MDDDKPTRATHTGAPLPTDLEPPRGKLFAGARAIVARIDINDPDQVFDLAAELATANRRRLMQATLSEHKAVAGFAVVAGFIASHAIRLVELVDGGAPVADIDAQRAALHSAVRASNPTRNAKGEPDGKA